MRQALFWAALVFALACAIVPAAYAPSTGLWDKFQHAAVFAVLAGLGVAAYGRARWTRIAAGLLAFGGAIELIQALPFIHRDAEWLDWAADGVGVVAVWLAVSARARLFP